MAEPDSARSYVEISGSTDDRAESTFRIAYVRRGTGDPALYIGGSGRSLADRPAVFDSPLPGSFAVIAHDQRGLGETGSPDGEWSVADYAADAAGLLAALGIGAAHVIGVSFGGMVAQELAIGRPDVVRRLVLVATSAGGAGGSSYPIHGLSAFEPHLRFELELELADTRHGPAWRASHPDEVDRLWELAQQRSAVSLPTAGESKQLDARRRHDCWDRLHRIASPTLVCAGRYDGVAPLGNAVALHSRLRNGRLSVFEGGHLLLRQDPTAWPVIAEFLTDRSDADPAATAADRGVPADRMEYPLS